MAEEIKSLLDAVSAGITEADTKPAAPEPKEDDTDESASGAADESGADGEAAAGESAASDDTAAGAEPKEGADGKDGDEETPEGAAGAHGKKTGKDGAVTPEAAAAAAAEAAKLAAGRKVDPVNDPFDKRWKQQTTERVQSLIDITKKQGAELENANVLFDAVASTGMEPDELAAMLGYARARHHGTAEQKKQAYSFLKDELKALALEVGETDVVDFMADHPDLQDAVAANQITAEYAREVALARSRGKRDTDNAAATSATQTAQQAHAAGVTALGQTGAALAKRDGEAVFLSKKTILVATLKPIFAQLHPSKWAQTFQQAYDALPKPAAAVVPPVVPAVPPRQPLRPGTPAGGGGKKEPKSMQEAVFAAFDQVE